MGRESAMRVARGGGGGGGPGRLWLPPLRALLKEMPAGRREEGTPTRAFVQAAGENKRGFSQANGARAGLVSGDFKPPVFPWRKGGCRDGPSQAALAFRFSQGLCAPSLSPEGEESRDNVPQTQPAVGSSSSSASKDFSPWVCL